MITDITFDGISLNDLGYTVVSFDGARQGEIDTDSQFKYNHIFSMRGKKQPFITAVYEDPLEMDIYIAKDFCNANTKDITVAEMAALKKTLVRPTPKVLTVSGNTAYSNVYWVGSFNVEEYVFGDRRVGAHLKFECDAPFGYYTDVTLTGNLSANGSTTYTSASNEIGYVYPQLEITLKSSGNLELYNAADGRTTKVNNCARGEVLTFTKNLQLSSSVSGHDVLSDFNFVFYRVNNTFSSGVNTLRSNLAISYKITYTPIAKVVIV